MNKFEKVSLNQYRDDYSSERIAKLTKVKTELTIIENVRGAEE